MSKKIHFFLNITIVFVFVFTFIKGNAQENNQKTPLPSPQQLWERCQETLPPFSYTIQKDEIIQSDTDPRKKLRRIEVRFTSQVVGQWMRRMEHTGIIFMPADPKIYQLPERRGKVVVVANRYGDRLMIDNYGEPIAARTGYPTMVVPIPGEYGGHDGESCWIYFLRTLLIDTKDPINHQYFRLAIPYISALDVFSGILKEKNIRAIIGGHSKRAPSAFNAAAMDPERIVGVIYMGIESTFSSYENKLHKCISPVYSQEYVRCPVFYIGATNEDGYEMFNINRLQAKMKHPWTIEYIPNFHHATYSEIQVLGWQMWISHIFEGRPLTKITGLSHEENEEGTIFRARIETPNKIIQTKVWYVYCDDVPFWRDLMWYPVFLHKKGDMYEAFVSGKLPDAWLVEVKDIANGFSGYVSSLPQDITHKPTKERYSQGWRSRNWEPKMRKINELSLQAQREKDVLSIKVPSPQELWERCQKSLPPLKFTIEKDEIVRSDTDPNQELRRIEVKFYSQEIEGNKWGHPCVVFLPADPQVYNTPVRRGKVVIIGQRSWDGLATGPWRNSFLGNYGEPIAVNTGYPTMICPVPGEYDGSDGREISIGFLRELRQRTNDPIDHSYFRLAIPYLRALDVMADILKVDRKEVRAIIGGHSKRATSAYTAAAVDPQRIVGVVYMGNESIWGSTRDLPFKAISPAYTKDWVKARVLYLGATNEDGYRMYNINNIQEIMKGAWTIEYIPNYRHASMSEKHFMNWKMWISHVFEGRPITRLRDFSYKEVDEGFIWGGRSVDPGTLFRVRIESLNKIIQAKIWYVYNDDEPFWRDLVWYPEFMIKRDGDYYEGYVKGKLPDAWLVEVKDIALGFPGYVSSLPHDITGKKTETKRSRGSRSRHWEPKKKIKERLQ